MKSKNEDIFILHDTDVLKQITCDGKSIYNPIYPSTTKYYDCEATSKTKETSQYRAGWTREMIDEEDEEVRKSHEQTCKVTELNLNDCNLENNEIPSIISKLEDLKHVYLYDTGITSLKPLKDNMKLTRIYADKNKIVELDGLENLKKLSVLTLTGNQVKVPLEEYKKLDAERLNALDVNDIGYTFEECNIIEREIMKRNKMYEEAQKFGSKPDSPVFCY